MWTDMLRDKDFLLMSMEKRYTWMMLILISGNSQEPGWIRVQPGIPYTREQFAGMVAVSVDILNDSLDLFLGLGMVKDYGPDGIKIENWERYQSEYDRLKKYKGTSKGTTEGTTKGTSESTPIEVDVDPRRREDSKEDKGDGAPGPKKPAPKPVAAEDIFLVFPTIAKGGVAGEYILTRQKLEEYKASFPAVNVEQECRSLRQWCIDNPARRKTLRGMPAFFSRNLSRKQDRGGQVAAGGASKRCLGASADEQAKYR